jgi:hypothetical protein
MRSRTVTRSRTVGGRHKPMRRRHIRGRGKFMDWARKATSWVKTNGPRMAQKALSIFRNPALRSLATSFVPGSSQYISKADDIIKAVTGSGRRRIRIPIRSSKNGKFRRGGSLGHGLGP